MSTEENIIKIMYEYISADMPDDKFDELIAPLFEQVNTDSNSSDWLKNMKLHYNSINENPDSASGITHLTYRGYILKSFKHFQSKNKYPDIIKIKF